jgi:hypothetical protein
MYTKACALRYQSISSGLKHKKHSNGLGDWIRTSIHGVAVRCIAFLPRQENWRKMWDSNPRNACTFNSLAGSSDRPLWQSSVIGRSTRIRTLDLCVPNAAHYQAVLYSVIWQPVSRTPYGQVHLTPTLCRICFT